MLRVGEYLYLPLILRGMIVYRLGIDAIYGMVHGGTSFPCKDNCLI